MIPEAASCLRGHCLNGDRHILHVLRTFVRGDRDLHQLSGRVRFGSLLGRRKALRDLNCQDDGRARRCTQQLFHRVQASDRPIGFIVYSHIPRQVSGETGLFLCTRPGDLIRMHSRTQDGSKN